MLVFSAITPHPPIIIPGIGQGDDLDAVEKTIRAMEELAKEFEKADPDTAVVISPHAPLDIYAFSINVNKKTTGSLLNFGLDKKFEFQSDTATIGSIENIASKNNIPISLHEQLLDHGTLVPLYYLAKKKSPELISLSFSFLNLRSHYDYGKLLGEVFRRSGKKIAVIASGDMSHRLIQGAPAGYSPRGKEFDKKLIQLLEKGDTEGILSLDEDFIEEAGECGLRSFVILLGILEGHFKFKKLSYEGPFGVGYLVAKA